MLLAGVLVLTFHRAIKRSNMSMFNIEVLTNRPTAVTGHVMLCGRLERLDFAA